MFLSKKIKSFTKYFQLKKAYLLDLTVHNWILNIILNTLKFIIDKLSSLQILNSLKYLDEASKLKPRVLVTNSKFQIRLSLQLFNK